MDLASGEQLVASIRLSFGLTLPSASSLSTEKAATHENLVPGSTASPKPPLGYRLEDTKEPKDSKLTLSGSNKWE